MKNNNVTLTENFDINPILSAMCSSYTFSLPNENVFEKIRPEFSVNGHTIKDVIFNNPATIIIWSDNTKTVVKCQDGDTYNKELGMAMCIVKKFCYNKGNYNNIFAKWIKD